ncbi:Cap-specific mRNA (nucleoside-2'-O-)-methyltransferase 2 [Araneus ventricosus]|uniref:Cap-specific mRNA (nucleoside-2'-O-)-methyltransferase 2 n=1 Tax=Araneus ventricosus TaxID=182803 RepID=A0A4Y2FS57_ARAVE|nr:Cap-specific mRNA (nucleoside-2'-O-)-methyltransferase 2 [Araneus ventricosus]
MDSSIILNSDYCFEQKFTFLHQNDWILPSEHSIFKDTSWNLEALCQLKRELNATKSLLNDKGEQWQEHTARINKANKVISFIKQKIQPEILTGAWCKFYEILSNYPLCSQGTESFKSLHLCEAPGAFISALNSYLCCYYRSICWVWLANTLNPYYEDLNIKDVICDDRLLFPTLKYWFFGKDNTGDITNPNYSKDLQEFISEKEYFNLVTADGGVDCSDNPAEQETVVAKLHFAEMLVALQNLAPGGSFVLKKFTFFECVTICKMYFLNCIFREVHVFKPFTSKSGNSEVYVVCLGYIGVEKVRAYLEQMNQNYGSLTDKSMFPLKSIPSSFISQLIECCKLFSELQTKSIQENLRLYSIPFSEYESELIELQNACAEKYIQRCSIQSHLFIERLFPLKKQIFTSFHDKLNRNLRKLRFQVVGDIFENLSKPQSMFWPDVILDVERRLTVCFPLEKKRQLDDIEWYFVPKEIKSRMKSKSYQNWLLMGKKISLIQNSKFCNPMLLHLWNRISYNPEINIQNHQPTAFCYWDIDNISSLLIESSDAENNCLVSMAKLKDEEPTKDPALTKLKETFSKSFNYNFLNLENQEANFPEEKKIVYINSTVWINSLHQEILIKQILIDVLCNVIKVMKPGDSLIICIQTLLTRYTTGIIYMMLSLFEKFQCFLPSDLAPAFSGQMWILSNFQNPECTSRILSYFETVASFKVPEEMEILEIVPIPVLCGGHFYEYLLDLNNNHMHQRLRSLTSTEKHRLKISV